MKKIILASVALAALSATTAAAQVAEPRAVAERVAAAVEENYFDEQRAHTIAAEVRTAAAAGRYDITNEADLAAALTATLHPHDGHFRVEYRPPQPNAPARPNGGFGNDARAAYGIPGVTMYPGGIGVVDFRLLADFDPDHFQAKYALDAAFTMVHGSQALILDLRDCAGGSPTMVGYILGHFFPEGANVYNTFHSRRGDQDESPPEQPASGRRLDTPLFVLTSGRTGSACESVAYTLQSAGRATIVGEPSAGGANPGGLIPVDDNLAVFVSMGTPVNPITHSNWEGAGVQPNVVTPVADALTRARALALEAALRAPADESAGREAQWALDSLNAESAAYPRNLRDYAGDYGARSVAIENNRLVLHRDRRPALILLPLERDLFAVSGAAPLQRVHFERNARGRVIAMTLSLVDGQEFHDLRAN
ncbi:MAG: S41 family peptidase [Alphaproteobacteria bacterium]|nr:S41 family peptidase [Alphaproteobacteria bacterium]